MRTNQRSQKYGEKCSSEARKECFCGTHIKRQKKNGENIIILTWWKEIKALKDVFDENNLFYN